MLVQQAESKLSELNCRFTFEGVWSYLCRSKLRCDPLSQVDDLGTRLSHFHTFVAVDLNLKIFLPIPPEQHMISPSPNDNLLGRAQITISHSIIARHLCGWHFAIDGTGILEYTGCECLGQYPLISSNDLFELAWVITVEWTHLNAYILPPNSCLILCLGVQPAYTRLCMG